MSPENTFLQGDYIASIAKVIKTDNEDQNK